MSLQPPIPHFKEEKMEDQGESEDIKSMVLKKP